VGRGEYLLTGFRNRDVREELGLTPSVMSYRLRVLRSHGVIRKVSGTHRYRFTDRGQELVAAVTKTLQIPASGENRETPP
jgi:predicted transcriptional regulator